MSNKNKKGGLVYSTHPEEVSNVWQELFSNEEQEKTTPLSHQKVRIRLERKAGNKEVTAIEGIEANEEELTDLTKKLKQLCGGGGTLKDGVIQIQGNHRERILKFLVDKGYKSTKLAGG